jgi:hypothetical protein
MSSKDARIIWGFCERGHTNLGFGSLAEAIEREAI